MSSTIFNLSEAIAVVLVSSTVSVEGNSSIPFLPVEGWCSPVDDSIDIDS
jgi:hypothetical protein